MIRLNVNERVDQMIDQLSGYNSPNNDRLMHSHVAKSSQSTLGEPPRYYYQSPSKKNYTRHTSYEVSEKNYS